MTGGGAPTRGLVRPGERRVVPVVADAREVEVEPEAVDVGLAGAGQREAPVRRVGGVVDVERLAAAVARGDALDLEGEDAGDGRPPLQAVLLEAARPDLHAAEIAHQVVVDHRRPAAGLAADDRRQGLALSGSRPLVDDAAEDPVALGHHPARADDQREAQPVERRITEIPLVEDAGAQVVAIAALHVLATEAPAPVGHRRVSPSIRLRSAEPSLLIADSIAEGGAAGYRRRG